MHPGLAIPVSDGRSALQRLTELVEPAQEDSLPRIPGEQPEDQPAARAHDLHRQEQKGVEKRFEFHAQDRGFLGGVAGGPPSGLRQPQRKPAFSVQASAAITMYAQLLSNVSTGIRVAPTPCFS